MKYARVCLPILFLLTFCGVMTSAQQLTDAGPDSKTWITVQSDDGEFEIDVPQDYVYFVDHDGIMVSNGSSHYQLTNMQMLNAVVDHCLVSIERFTGTKKGLDALRDGEKAKNETKTEIKGSVPIKQTVFSTDFSYVVRQFLTVNDHVYVLTAGSRAGEQAVMRRFLDSFHVFQSTPTKLRDGVVPLSKLKITTVTVDADLSSPLPAPTKQVMPPPPKDAARTNLVLLTKTRPIYPDEARAHLTTGTAILKVTFSKDGFIPTIVVRKTLPDGLLRACVMAALRIKFLPPENDGVPRTVTKQIEYSFDIGY
jgi:hypothetical protein